MQKITIIIGIAVVGAIIAAFMLFGDGGKGLSLNRSGGDAEKEEQTEEVPKSITEVIQGGVVEPSPTEEGKEVYKNSQYGFSMMYPEGFTVGALPDLGGDVFLVQSADRDEEFQIYIAPFDEPGPITASRIAEDLPDLLVSDAQQVVLGPDKIEALIFNGESEDFGSSREVWFVYGGYLYQITTHAEADQFIGPILETWTFGN